MPGKPEPPKIYRLQVYVWYPLLAAIGKYARENREHRLLATPWDGDPSSLPEPGAGIPMTIDQVILESLQVWIHGDYPEHDWRRFSDHKKESAWGPLAKDSALRLIDTPDPIVGATPIVLEEKRRWLGPGSRIRGTFQSRATLAVVGTYLEANLHGWNNAPDYTERS